MKIYKILMLSAFVLFAGVACEGNSQKKKVETATIVKEEKLQKIAVEIEGMTCQIGCAKTIESKLSKTAGVSSAVVTFDKKLGEIVYDSNQITKEEISEKITNIAGGDTYSVVSVKEVKL